MFNIYYINYTKAYEIAMLIDNKLLESKTREKASTLSGHLEGDIDETSFTKVPFIGKYMPRFDFDGEVAGEKSSRVIDTVNVITTKSTILGRIYDKAKEIQKLESKEIGRLIRLKDVSLKVKNENDILGAKTLLSGAIGDIAVDGVGNVNLSTLLEVMFKDSSYILDGTLPKAKDGKEEKICIKIPMQAENEMENQYSITDLEIGKITIVGIYRGCFIGNELDSKLNKFTNQTDGDEPPYDINIAGDDDEDETDKVHYIDVIAIVQDIKF